MIFSASPAVAEEPVEILKKPEYGWAQVWTGADAMRDVWLIYSGVTLAPWSAHIHEPGWRLRATTGYGEYAYRLMDAAAGPLETGHVAYGTAQAGYQWRLGELTAKVFGGLAYIDHMVRPTASKGHLVGADWGPRADVELWYNFSPTQWTSLNASFTTAHDTASLRWRYGVRLWDFLSVGPEIRLDTNASLYESWGDVFHEYEGRAGAFAAASWNGYELSVAAGVASYVKGLRPSEETPYGTVNLLIPF